MALELTAAAGLASLAAAGGRSWRGLARGVTAMLPRLPAGAVLVLRCSGLRASPEAARRALPAARGLALGAALALVFGSLFASADRAFAHLAGETLARDIDLGLAGARAGVFLGVVALAGALAVSLLLASDGGPEKTGGGRHRGEWLVALFVLDALFALFVAVQLSVLFGGHDHVLSTAGLTYAEYAREGFLQLLVVALLTVGVIAASVHGAGRPSGRRPDALELLLGLLCLLTFVVLASALRRLGLYEQAFGYTLARLAGQVATLWVAAVLALVVAAGLARRGDWLPRATTLLSAGALLAFGLLNPEGLVAERNVDRLRRTGEVDLAYLKRLGPDAAPALSRLPPRLASCSLASTAAELEQDDGPFELNLARARAREAVDGLAGPASTEDSAGFRGCA